MKTADGYIRVSQVNKRSGDSFISPEVQREQIEGWARLRGVEIAAWHEDMDQSGGKLDRPGLTKAIKRIEARETDGIAVAKLDRLSRLGVGDALKLVEQIHEAGGSIAALDLGIDPTTTVGEFGMTIMLALARMERRRLADSWGDASSRALADGVHLAQAPTGYRRADGKRSKLVPDPVTAPLVREAFLRRARGDSWGAIADFMIASGLPVSRSGVVSIVKNRVYLGEARGGVKGQTHPGAHEPIVTVEEWERAQGKGRSHGRNGSLAAEGLLSGLVTCAACGHKLSVQGGPRAKDGSRKPAYFCKTHFASGRCPAPGGAKVAFVDEFVRAAMSQALLDGTLKGSVETISRYNRAAAAVRRAQADLDALSSDAGLVASLGVEGLGRLAASQKAVLDAAKQELRETPEPAETLEPMADLWEEDAWPIERQRQLARQFIAEVTLARGRTVPVPERVAIRWVGSDDFDETIWDRMQAADADLPVMPSAA